MEIGLKQITIGIGVFILIGGIVINVAKSKFMVSKKVAAKNLHSFLERNYNNKLDYSDLDRFFNSGNMNPNCFIARVFEKENPKVELIITFDAKKINDQKDIPSDSPGGLSFNERYLERVLAVRKQNEISELMEPLGVTLEWGYNEIIFSFKKEYTEAEIQKKEEYFLTLFNEEKSEILGYYHEIPLLLNIPPNTNISIEHNLEQVDSIWKLKNYRLHKKGGAFNHIKETVDTEINKYLKKSHLKQKTYDYYDSYINSNNFNNVLWITATETIKTKKEIEEREKGVWVSPITGYIKVYYNSETKEVHSIDFVPISAHLSMEEMIAKEEKAFLSTKW